MDVCLDSSKNVVECPAQPANVTARDSVICNLLPLSPWMFAWSLNVMQCPAQPANVKASAPVTNTTSLSLPIMAWIHQDYVTHTSDSVGRQKVGSGESFVPESDVECPTWLANVMSDDSTMCILLPTHVVRHYQCLLCLGSSKTIFHMQLQHRCWVKVVGGSHILQPWLQPIHLYCNGHSLSHRQDTIDCRLPSHMDLTSEVLT